MPGLGPGGRRFESGHPDKIGRLIASKSVDLLAIFISTNRDISIEISESKQNDILFEPIVSFCPCPIAFYCVIIKIIREKTSLVYFLINIGDILFIICMFTKQIRSFAHCILYRSSFLLFLLNNVLISYGNQYILINSKIKCT